MRRNYKLLIQYDGSRYFGWEHQPGVDTIQGRLEKAIESVCNVFPEINGAGRTDAGVHAREMCANVFLDTRYTPAELLRYINEELPEDIAVTDIRIASDNFHARYSAAGKTYVYVCHYGDYRAVFDRKYVNELSSPPDIEVMRRAAAMLKGRHDFAAFCKQPGSYSSTIRIVDRIDITERNGYIRFTFHGTGFMRNMVRILVGTLLDIGYGKINEKDVKSIMDSGDRRLSGHTAPACGLCLMKVDY